MGIIIAIHVLVCMLLIVIILIQAGRGGGLVESFSGVESMFGPKTNTFLTRTTTILSMFFFMTCVSLAVLSARQSQSLMRDVKTQEQPQLPAQAQPQAATSPENQSQPETKPVQEAKQPEPR